MGRNRSGLVVSMRTEDGCCRCCSYHTTQCPPTAATSVACPIAVAVVIATAMAMRMATAMATGTD